MLVLELFNREETGHYNERNDQSISKKDDSRRTRLTLAHLNQLRQGNDVRKLEHEKKLKSVSQQYTPAPEAGGAPLGL